MFIAIIWTTSSRICKFDLEWMPYFLFKGIRKQDAVLIAVFIHFHAFRIVGELIKDLLPFNLQRPMTSKIPYSECQSNLKYLFWIICYQNKEGGWKNRPSMLLKSFTLYKAHIHYRISKLYSNVKSILCYTYRFPFKVN